jgi:hypothetical protein
MANEFSLRTMKVSVESIKYTVDSIARKEFVGKSFGDSFVVFINTY